MLGSGVWPTASSFSGRMGLEGWINGRPTTAEEAGVQSFF